MLSVEDEVIALDGEYLSTHPGAAMFLRPFVPGEVQIAIDEHPIDELVMLVVGLGSGVRVRVPVWVSPDAVSHGRMDFLASYDVVVMDDVWAARYRALIQR